MSTEEAEPAAANAAETPPAKPKRSKRPFTLGGGAAGMIALGWAAALVALPANPNHLNEGAREPIPLNVSPPSGFQVNLSGFGGKNYLAMTLIAEVVARDVVDVHERSKDPLHEARLSDAVLKVAARKTKTELADAPGKEILREELRDALDEILFPVVVGNRRPDARHAESGLAPGLSIDRSTMRGSFDEHILELDGPAKTIRLDGGGPVAFVGAETDLEVRNPRGDKIYVDVSRYVPDFQGEVHAGVLGSVQNVYFTTFLVQ